MLIRTCCVQYKHIRKIEKIGLRINVSFGLELPRTLSFLIVEQAVKSMENFC